MPTLVKQFGEKRTGSSYLMVLIRTNFNNQVISNLLGWKHGIPERLSGWVRYMCDPITAKKPMNPDIENKDLAMVESKNLFEKMNKKPEPADLQNMAEHHEYVMDHLDQLAFTVSIKNPFAWMHSVLVFESTWGKGRFTNKVLQKRLCDRYNYHYRAWYDFCMDNRRFMFVQHEKLLTDWEKVLYELKNRLNLDPVCKEFKNVTKVVKPNASQAEESFDKRKSFGREYYLKKEYMADLTEDCKKIIESNIDWALMEKYGYTLDQYRR